MGQPKSKEKLILAQRPNLFNYNSEFINVGNNSIEEDSVKILSWNILAEAYKYGHQINYVDVKCFNTD